MGRICYVPKKFTLAHQDIIAKAEEVCARYADAGLSLTLRQLYYQFIAADLFPEDRKFSWTGQRWMRDPEGTRNADPNYKWLSEILTDARMAGELDWDYLIDRTRNLAKQPNWPRPSALIKAAGKQYRIDLWKDQRQRVEVWIEKDAAIGVIEQVCRDNDVPYFSCRGYTSISEVFEAGQRLGGYLRRGERVTVLHIGDHDPSGLDMSRDIEARLRTFVHQDWIADHRSDFAGQVTRGQIRASMRNRMGLDDGVLPWEVKRIALNVPQIRRYNPPPNPAKATDSRFQRYQEETGLDESWELDALDPFVLQALINSEVERLRDESKWSARMLEMEQGRALIKEVGEHWGEIRDRYRTEEMGQLTDELLADSGTDEDYDTPEGGNDDE